LKATCLTVIKLKGYGTSLTSYPKGILYPKGGTIVTTATNYFYMISHPATQSQLSSSGEYEVTPAPLNSDKWDRQIATSSPLAVHPSSSSPLTAPLESTNMRSRSNSDSYVIGASISSSLLQSSQTFPLAPPLPAVYYKHQSGVPAAVVCLHDGINFFIGDTAGTVTWYEMRRKDILDGGAYPGGTYIPVVRGKYVLEDGRLNVRVLHMQVENLPFLLFLKSK
jgi:hypothetical protein